LHSKRTEEARRILGYIIENRDRNKVAGREADQIHRRAGDQE
jgi:hypothetical protein